MNFLKTISLLILVGLTISCASASKNLSPQGIEAFNKTRIIKGLDVIRDTAVDANKTVPPLISTATTRKIVTYHRSSLLIVNAQGAKALTTTSLDELVKDLPKSESDLLAPYISLAKVIINEVNK